MSLWHLNIGNFPQKLRFLVSLEKLEDMDLYPVGQQSAGVGGCPFRWGKGALVYFSFHVAYIVAGTQLTLALLFFPFLFSCLAPAWSCGHLRLRLLISFCFTRTYMHCGQQHWALMSYYKLLFEMCCLFQMWFL